MAIPLSMPNSDDIDDGHRLDLLLEQLLITLRQVLIHRRRVAAAAAAAAAVSRTSSAASHVRHRHETTNETIRTNVEEQRTVEGLEETRVVPTGEVVGEGEVTTTATTTSPPPVVQFPLPDLVLDSSTSGKGSPRTVRTCQCDRRIQCYHHHHHHHHHHHCHLHAGSPTSWVDDGGELIRLAGQLLHQVRSAAKEP